MSNKKLNAVLVLWNDSNVTHGWRHDDCEGDNVAHCRTVGILKHENDALVVVAFGDSDCNSVMETIVIPKGCITAIKKLRVR